MECFKDIIELGLVESSKRCVYCGFKFYSQPRSYPGPTASCPMPLRRRHRNMNLKRIYVIAETDAVAGPGIAAATAPGSALFDQS